MTPAIGDEVVVLYRDPSSILARIGIPEIATVVAYGRLGVQTDNAGKMTGITVETGGGATFIDTDSVVSITLTA